MCGPYGALPKRYEWLRRTKSDQLHLNYSIYSTSYLICCFQSSDIELDRYIQIAHRPLPSSRSARVLCAYNRCTARTARSIPRSWLLERCCERRGYVIGGGRLLLVPSRWRGLQKPRSIEVLSALLGRGADRRWGIGASYRSKVRGRRAGFPHHRASSRLD